MKRLVLCCDGTWNSPEGQSISNIEKLARSVELVDTQNPAKPVAQQVTYVGGVGTGGYRMDQALGGLLGLGLERNVLAGYRALALNYEDEDEIFVFGFSRGAYTARAVVGLINDIGLVTREQLLAGVTNAGAESVFQAIREAFVAGTPASPPEGLSFGHPPIRFVGVFDTVGARGIPIPLSRKRRFNDTRLSPSVDCARQALALDDRRIAYIPCLWDVSAPSEPAASAVSTWAEEHEIERVKQVWFPGGHSDVGGGRSQPELTVYALAWMMQEASRCGLSFAAHPAPTRPVVLEAKVRPSLLFRILNYLPSQGMTARTRDLTRTFEGGGRPQVKFASHLPPLLELDDYSAYASNLGRYLDAPAASLSAVLTDSGALEEIPYQPEVSSFTLR